MRLRHIEVFHAVYTYGSITAAAKHLSVSQPSVSKVLAHAEQQLGYALFDRVKGKVIPTLEAERLIGHVSDVYQSIDELQRVSHNIADSDRGCIRLAVTPAFGIDLVPSAIASYVAVHPETEFELETLHYHQLIRALKQSRIDLGLAFHPSTTPDISIEQLARAEFVILADSGVLPASEKRISLKDIDNTHFIRLSDRGPLGQLLSSRLESDGFSQTSNIKAETYQMAKALAAYGAGMTIVDEITAWSSGHDNVVAHRLDPAVEFNIGLMHLESTPLSIVTRRFTRHLKSCIRDFLTHARK